MASSQLAAGAGFTIITGGRKDNTVLGDCFVVRPDGSTFKGPNFTQPRYSHGLVYAFGKCCCTSIMAHAGAAAAGWPRSNKYPWVSLLSRARAQTLAS
jgi:hypothetical protein